LLIVDNLRNINWLCHILNLLRKSEKKASSNTETVYFVI